MEAEFGLRLKWAELGGTGDLAAADVKKAYKVFDNARALFGNGEFNSMTNPQIAHRYGAGDIASFGDAELDVYLTVKLREAWGIKGQAGGKPRKAAPNKAAPKKAVPKKAAPKKAAPKKAAPKKAAPKKAAPKK